jgi:RecA-family ATPase
LRSLPWLDRNRNARTVIIDVFAKLRGASAPGASAYDADYTAVGRIKKVADHHGMAVLMVHHVRKAASEDFLSEVSGTNGIAGESDPRVPALAQHQHPPPRRPRRPTPRTRRIRSERQRRWGHPATRTAA